MEIEVMIGDGLIMLPPFWAGEGGLTVERHDGVGKHHWAMGRRISGGALLFKEGRWGFYIEITRGVGARTFDLPRRFHFVDEEPWWPALAFFGAKPRTITPDDLPALMEEIAAATGESA